MCVRKERLLGPAGVGARRSAAPTLRLRCAAGGQKERKRILPYKIFRPVRLMS